ncbi:MAG TPA: hypothetical protein VE781_06280 [Kineosporiaceae bacterium]|nr:hypothetical protein [Kineosporiaceae bacterium]
MTTTSHLALVDPDRRRVATLHDPSDLVGASRPAAVRALLARSVTMTALDLERRLRTRRRQPSTQVRLESLLRQQRQADRLRTARHTAELRLAATGPGPR